MMNVDGSHKSGSGTIVRLSLAIAAISGRALHIFNIRQKRPQPGLRPQHLKAVLTAAKLCNATVEGANVGSRELWFYPSKIIGGTVKTQIGTAGSIPMLLITILPICAFAKKNTYIHISRGGTDVSYSPTINYLIHVFLPVLNKMGIAGAIKVHKYGYYPKGMGEVLAELKPIVKLSPIRNEKFGTLTSIEGVSVCTRLSNRRVAERQAKAANEFLMGEGYPKAEIKVVNDYSNPLQKGSSLVLWARTSTGSLLGGDAIGELRKSSEDVGREAARKLVQEMGTKATFDIHLADLLIPYMALAEDNSVFLTRLITDHLETNIWLAEKFLDVKFQIQKTGNLFKVEKKES